MEDLATPSERKAQSTQLFTTSAWAKYIFHAATIYLKLQTCAAEKRVRVRPPEADCAQSVGGRPKRI